MSALVKIKAEDFIKREAKPASLLDQKRKQQKITLKPVKQCQPLF